MGRKIREGPEEEDLWEREAKFRTLAETIPSGIFVSRGKRLHYVNHAAEVITGYNREELLSMNFWDLVHPETREPVIHRGRSHLEEIGRATPCDVRMIPTH